jgi:hypothetical protein
MIIKRKLKSYLLLALALFVAGVMIAEEAFAAAWFNENWLYRRQITIDHTKVEDVADPSTTYANFPLLVFATGLSNINANGTDIRFTESDGTTELPREIESYSGGTLYAWVNFTLTKDSGDSTDDVIYMYYGNPAATEPAPSSTYGSENVWDSNFKMVQHLNETSGAHLDSTSNNNDSSTINVTQQGQTGTAKISGADEFTTDQQIIIPDAASLNFGGSSATFSAWIYARTLGENNQGGILSKSGIGGQGYRFEIDAANCLGGSELLAWYGGAMCSTANAVTLNDWEYVIYVYDSVGDMSYIYVNGLQDNTLSSSTTNGDATENFLIGEWGGRSFDGFIDEVRISNTNRSADWIATSYSNQNNPSAFLTFSEQVSIPTMTQWGMIIFMVLAGLGSIYYMRR